MRIRDLNITYPNGNTIFHGLNLEITSGSYNLICGPNGSGKSTLALALSGSLSATISGEIETIDTAIVWQDPGAQMCGMSLLDEVRLPMDYRNIPANLSTEKAMRLLANVSLNHLPMQRDPLSLSGGEQQRLAFAASLAQDADILILDEATSQLDLPSRQEFLRILTRANPRTILAIDHNIECHIPFADRIIILGENGQIVWDKPHLPADTNSFGIRLPGSFLKPSTPAPPLQTSRTLNLGEFELPYGSIAAVTGPNGSGKSSFLRSLTQRKRLLQQGIAWLPQRGSHYLRRRTVAEELGSGFTSHQVGLQGLEQAHPLSLSGGQRQRLALAHTLGEFHGNLALLDEPSYSQDLTGTQTIIDLVTANAANRVTLVATHDTMLIQTIATHIIEIDNGKVSSIQLNKPTR